MDNYYYLSTTETTDLFKIAKELQLEDAVRKDLLHRNMSFLAADEPYLLPSQVKFWYHNALHYHIDIPEWLVNAFSDIHINNLD